MSLENYRVPDTRVVVSKKAFSENVLQFAADRVSGCSFNGVANIVEHVDELHHRLRYHMLHEPVP